MLNHAEWAILPTHNYLLIHKTGCSYVRQVFDEFYKNQYDMSNTIPTENQKNICWTIIRDPHERFISGLAYDLWLTKANFDHIFLDLPNLINGHISTHFRTSARVQHTISQISYLFYQPISIFVDMKNLTEFCFMNFGVTLSEDYKNKVPNEYKKLIIEEIKKRNLQQRMDDLLSYETHVYNKIVESDHMWRWQNGNVLGTGL